MSHARDVYIHCFIESRFMCVAGLDINAQLAEMPSAAGSIVAPAAASASRDDDLSSRCVCSATFAREPSNSLITADCFGFTFVLVAVLYYSIPAPNTDFSSATTYITIIFCIIDL